MIFFFFTITDLLIIKCCMLQNDGSHMSTNQLIFAILLDLINESNIDVINWYIWYDYALKGGQNALKVQLKI